MAQKIGLSGKIAINLRNDDFAVVGKVGNQLVGYAKQDNVHILFFFQQDMTLHHKSVLSFMEADASNIEFFPTAQSLFIFYGLQKGKNFIRYATKMKQDSSFESPIKIYELPFKSNQGTIHSDVQASEKNNFFVVSSASKTDDFNTLYSCVVDENLLLKQQTKQIALDKTWLMTNAQVISNEGEVFWLAVQKTTNKAYCEGLKMLWHQIDEVDFQLIDVATKNYFVGDLNIKINEKDRMLYALATYTKGMYDNPLGFFIYQYSLFEHEIMNTNFTPLTLASGKQSADLKDLKIKHLALVKNGGIEATLEKTFQNVRTINSFSSSMSMTLGVMMDNSRTVNEFYYNEIDVFHFDVTGKMKWSQTILKNQVTADDNGIFSSFGCHIYPIGKAYIFNDDNLRSNRLIGAYVSSTGQLNVKEIALTSEANSMNLLPRSLVQISSSEVIMPCLGKDYLRFLKIQF
jgi:hypothetical protein